jgi:hypothetical protein
MMAQKVWKSKFWRQKFEKQLSQLQMKSYSCVVKQLQGLTVSQVIDITLHNDHVGGDMIDKSTV